MDHLINQINSGTIPYITIADIKDCLRDQIIAKASVTFFKNCLESVTADKSGLFVLNGGAAAACHDDEHRGMLKCIDFDYYNSTREWLDLQRLQHQLQTCVQNEYDNLSQLTEKVPILDDIIVLKCFQNGAFRFNGTVQLNLLPHVKIVCTNFNSEFNLVRFALQVEMRSLNGVDEYTNQKMIMNRGAVGFNVFFVNIRVMKVPLLMDRCIKTFPGLGKNYRVVVSSLQRVLTDQIMCLIKDMFTNKQDFKVARRKAHIRALFAKLPQEAFDVCINGHTDVEPIRHPHESITSFCKKILDIHGPALACDKLVYAYFKTDSFTNQVPDYVAHYVNRPQRDWNATWKEFIFFLLCI